MRCNTPTCNIRYCMHRRARRVLTKRSKSLPRQVSAQVSRQKGSQTYICARKVSLLRSGRRGLPRPCALRAAGEGRSARRRNVPARDRKSPDSIPLASATNGMEGMHWVSSSSKLLHVPLIATRSRVFVIGHGCMLCAV